jgi:enoyl-CoA hydratase
MLTELHEVLDFLSEIPRGTDDPLTSDAESFPRVVLLQAAGPAFCAGVDIVDADSKESKWDYRSWHSQHLLSSLVEKLYALPQAVVCCIAGPAVGIGLSLALACDIRIGTTSSSFSAAFISLGISGTDMGTSYLLPRIIGSGRSTELMLTGRTIDGSTAFSWGLLNHIVDSVDEIKQKSDSIVKSLLSTSPWGLYITKRQIQASLGHGDLKSVITAENSHQVYLLSRPDVIKMAKAKLRKISSKL